jgi:hypothetical protein
MPAGARGVWPRSSRSRAAARGRHTLRLAADPRCTRDPRVRVSAAVLGSGATVAVRVRLSTRVVIGAARSVRIRAQQSVDLLERIKRRARRRPRGQLLSRRKGGQAPAGADTDGA